MSKQLLALVAICSLALPTTMLAQQSDQPPPNRGRIIGIVATTTGPLLAAEVAVRNAADSTIATVTTSLEGRFLVDRVPFGEYTLRISYLGYRLRIVPGIAVSSSAPFADVGMLKLEAAVIAVTDLNGSKR